jgi:hypothetical protein
MTKRSPYVRELALDLVTQQLAQALSPDADYHYWFDPF